MTRREQIARFIAPEIWHVFDKRILVVRDEFISGTRETWEPSKEDWSNHVFQSLEAADRLIADGLICDPETDDTRMNGR